MWLTRFGEYINRGWREAATVALIFSLIPLMGWVSIVILAFITLRKGPQQGFVIFLVTALPSLLFWSAGIGFLWVLIVLTGNLLTWILAVVLRETSDWSKVLFAALLLVTMVVAVLHLLIPDMQGYWYHILQSIYAEANKDADMLMPVPPVHVKQYFFNMARMIMPMLILIQVLIALTNLLLARWWQAKLFNPRGLAKELYDIRLSLWCGVILLVTIITLYMGEPAGWDILPMLIFMYFLVGVVVFHGLIEFRKAKTTWLWLFFGLVVLLFPYSLVVVAGLGIADSFVDFRARMARSIKNGEK